MSFSWYWCRRRPRPPAQPPLPHTVTVLPNDTIFFLSSRAFGRAYLSREAKGPIYGGADGLSLLTTGHGLFRRLPVLVLGFSEEGNLFFWWFTGFAAGVVDVGTYACAGDVDGRLSAVLRTSIRLVVLRLSLQDACSSYFRPEYTYYLRTCIEHACTS